MRAERGLVDAEQALAVVDQAGAKRTADEQPQRLLAARERAVERAQEAARGGSPAPELPQRDAEVLVEIRIVAVDERGAVLGDRFLVALGLEQLVAAVVAQIASTSANDAPSTVPDQCQRSFASQIRASMSAPAGTSRAGSGNRYWPQCVS